jgi:ABC-type multidrug transport system fused ATPase/permease subunit
MKLMNKLIRNLLLVMTPEQRKKLFVLQILVVVSAVCEVVSVLSIGPFMAMVGNAELVDNNALLNFLFLKSGADNPLDFLALSGFIVLGFMFLAAMTSIVTIWRLSIFAANVGAEFGDRLYEFYIKKNYLYHASLNSSELIKKIATEVTRVTDNILQPMVQINARIATIFFISVFIFIYNPYIAIIGVLVLSIAYLLLYATVKNRLAKNGQLISEFSSKRFSLMNEGFGSIKELHLLGRESYFVELFKNSGKVFAAAYGSSNSLYNMPRYFMEFVVYSSMVGLILVLLKSYGGELSAVLPVLGVFGIAAFKLLPSFQQIYSGAAQIRSNKSAFDGIKDDLVEAASTLELDLPRCEYKISGDVKLKDVCFRYDEGKNQVLKNVSLEIPLNSTVGIVGPSGSGKSTLLDILIGAIPLESGYLQVGEKIVGVENLRSWQNSIGYVSQMSLIKDGTVAENIAFGIGLDEIDRNKLERAAKMAHLKDWLGSLSQGIDTMVGERGVQISGGQRQRIAIARALYNDADYLFFDEATSALDGITEKSILSSISEMAEHKTIVMIAHRLNTVKDCDVIYVIKDGTVQDFGDYQSLIERNEHFNLMAGTVQ